jgi:hypothetical protein
MFTLEEVVPWGRSFDEYQHMFRLNETDLHLSILGCGDGPAGFNAEATRRGVRVTSCDPVYQFDAAQIRARVDETARDVLAQTRQNAHEFVWTSIESVEALEAVRMEAMETFLRDYPAGKREGRYVDARLPTLPFADAAFDLALSSHFLFLYSSQLGEQFHVRAVREMCRVAREVRIFPLLALGGTLSPLVDVVARDLRLRGYETAIEDVPYEFQRGGNQMLRIRASARRPAQRSLSRVHGA